MTFYAKPPKWLMNFCKPIKLLHSNDYTLYLHDTILSRTAGLASCHHAQIVLRWLAGGTRNVLLLLATQYRNGTKEEFERGQISATEACLPERGGPRETWGWGYSESKRSKWLPNESLLDTLLHTLPLYYVVL